MPPKTTPIGSASNSASSPSTTLETHTTLETNEYDHLHFVRELSQIITTLKKIESGVHDGRRLVVKGMEENLEQHKTALNNLIEDATELSPDLLMHFLEKTAKQLLKDDVARIAEIIGLFVKQDYFGRYPEHARTVHRLVMTLIATLNLVTAETSQKRKMLLAAITPHNSPAMADTGEEKEGEPGRIPAPIDGASDFNLDTSASVAEMPEGTPENRPEGSPAVELDEKTRVYLIDHFINEIKRKKAEMILSATDLRNAIYHRNVGHVTDRDHLLMDLNATITDNNQQADWNSCLNDLVEAYQLSATELRHIFLRLQTDQAEVKVEVFKQRDKTDFETQRIATLSAKDYFFALLPKYIRDPGQTKQLIESYFYANTQPYTTYGWMIFLFKSLYRMQLDNPLFPDESLLRVATEMMDRMQSEANASGEMKDAKEEKTTIPAEIALIPVIEMWSAYASHFRAKPEIAVRLQRFARQWLQSGRASSFKSVGFAPSFFDRLLSSWKTEVENNHRLVPDGYLLRTSENGQPLYQLPIPTRLTGKKYLLTYYLMLSQLTPLIDNKEAFIKRCETLFAHASLTAPEWNELHRQFVNNGKLPPDSPDVLLPYKTALIHLLRKKELEPEETDLPTVISTLMPDQDVAIYNSPNSLSDLYRDLTRMNKPQEGRTGAVTLLERAFGEPENKYQPLIPVATFQQHFSIQLQLMYAQLLQFIIHTTHYDQLESTPYFSAVPALLESLVKHEGARGELIRLILDNEEKAEASNNARVNAFCRAVAIYDAQDVDGRGPTRLFDRLSTYLDRYKDLPYYQLAKANISVPFYESFNDKDHPFARQYILKFAATAAFANLYRDKRELQVYGSSKTYWIAFEDIKTHFIRLLGVPNTRQSVIDEKVLSSLHVLFNLVDKGSRAEMQLYASLRTLLLNFDHKNANQDMLLKALSLIQNILTRFQPDEGALKHSYISKITKAIATDKDSELEANLQAIISEMRTDYPYVDDIFYLLKNDATTLIAFLAQLRQRNKMDASEWVVNNKANEALDALMNYIGNQLASTQNRMLDMLTAGANIVKIITATNSQGQPWLQVAWNNNQIILCHQLMLVGADECQAFTTDKNASFIDVFLKALSDNSRLLESPVWYNTMVYLFTKTNPKTKAKIAEWLIKQISSSAALENKSHEEANEEKEVDQLTPAVLPTEFLTRFFENVDPANMPDIALALIEADLFELLKALNDVHLAKTRRAVWTDSTGRSMLHAFDVAFRKTLKMPHGTYQHHMTSPGFFTSHHHLIAPFHQAKPDVKLSYLKLALEARIDEAFTELMGSQYIAAIRTIQSKEASWELKDNTRGLYDQVMQIVEEHKQDLSMNDIIRLYNVVAALDIPALYPIKTALAEIFKTPSDTWHNKIIKLIDTEFNFFKIAQMDPDEVMRAFKRCDPSFDTELKRPGAIEYAFRIYGHVMRDLKNYPTLAQWKDKTEKEKEEVMGKVMEMYKNNMPGEWDEAADTAYMTALTLLAQYTLGKVPFHTQFVIVLLTMNLTPARARRLLEDIATNQGKTFTLALVIAAATKRWKSTHKSEKPRRAAVVTLTDHLARDNAQENKPLYDALGLTSSDDINSNTLIRYTTTEKLAFKKVAEDIAPAFEDGAKVDKSERIIFVDETDVPLFDYNGKVISASGLVVKEMNPVLRIIWKGVDADTPDADIKDQLNRSDAYKNLPDFLKRHLDDEFRHFIQKAKAVKADPTVAEQKSDDEAPKTGAIMTVEKETGIIAENSIGRNGEPQFRQMKMFGADTPITHYELPHDTIYIREVFSEEECEMLFGVSGTLGSPEELQQYKDNGYTVVKTARFSEQQLTLLPAVLCDTDDEWNDAIYRFTKEKIDNGQPVLLFFESIAAVKAFYKRHYEGKEHGKVNLFMGKETKGQYDRIVREATEAGTITLSTIIGGRGIDFQLINEAINKKGGLVVGITAVIDSFNVYLQLLARTARRNNNGMAINFISRGRLLEILRDNNMSCEDLSKRNFMDKIDTLRKQVLKHKFRSLEQEQKKNYPWILSRDFYGNKGVLQSGPNQAYRQDQYRRFLLCYSLAEKGRTREAVDRYNEEFKREIIAPRTLINVVLVLDVSGSMKDQLDAAKAKLAELPKAIAKSNPSAKLQVAVIAYSDYEDNTGDYEKYSDNANHWLTYNTTASTAHVFSDVGPALTFLNSVNLLHGHDTPEAMELALYKARNLNWPFAKNGDRLMRQVFIVSDAPPHGAGYGGDHFPLSNPAKLNWSQEAASLKGLGVEMHMIACSTSYRDTYNAIAGITGSVTDLSNASTLINNITQKVQQSDDIDQKLSGLSSMCVSEQISREALLDEAAKVIQATMGVRDVAEARDIAAAKLAGMENRNRVQ